MRRSRRILLALAFAAPLLASGPAWAGTDRPPASPGEMLDQAIEQAAAALRALLDAIPRYAPPEIRENGDIVIRRLSPPPPPPPPGSRELAQPEAT